MTERRILLVSPDLMVASQLTGLVRSAGCGLDTWRDLGAEPAGGPWHLVLVDLQALTQDVAEIVGRVRAVVRQWAGDGTAAAVVAFGPHVDRQRLAAALAAGADEAVSRGELIGGFGALVARCSARAAGANPP